MGFAKKLRLALASKGWSVRELTEQPGLRSHSAINRWLRGEAAPMITDLPALARALGVTVAYLADDAIDEPSYAGPAGDVRLSAIVEKARRLGVERAGYILDTAENLGAEEAVARLLGLRCDGAPHAAR